MCLLDQKIEGKSVKLLGLFLLMCLLDQKIEWKSVKLLGLFLFQLKIDKARIKKKRNCTS